MDGYFSESESSDDKPTEDDIIVTTAEEVKGDLVSEESNETMIIIDQGMYSAPHLKTTCFKVHSQISYKKTPK